jgi:hypothetical protein
MTATEPSSKKPAPGEEYIDIIDVMGFLWRAKVFVIAGALIGVITSISVALAKKPPVFVTTLPVILQVAGAAKPEDIVSKFNGLLSLPNVQNSLISKGVEFIGGKLPFKLKTASGNVRLEYSSELADPAGEKALVAAQALASAAEDLNKKIYEASAQSHLDKQPQSDLEIQFARVSEAQAREESPHRIKLFEIETSLAQKSGSRPIPAAFIEGTSIGDDVLRLIAAAKLSDTERLKIVNQYSELVGKIKAIQAKYEPPIKDMTDALTSLSSGVLGAAMSESGSYPVLLVSAGQYKASVAAGNHERYENMLPLFGVLGVLLGALSGMMAYGLLVFSRENADRLRGAFSQSSN